MINLLLTHPDIARNAEDALCVACEEGFPDVVEILLGVPGIDVNKINGRGKTPLLCTFGDMVDQVECVKLLLSRPEVDVNKPDSGGRTLLLRACELNDLALATLLLGKADVDLNQRDRQAT